MNAYTFENARVLLARARFRDRLWTVAGTFWNHTLLRAVDNGDEIYVDEDDDVDWYYDDVR